MKISLLTTLLLLFSPSLLQADDLPAAKVPAPITSYVEKNHPKAVGVEWDFEKDENLYEADFTVDGLEHELKFSPAGELVYSEIDLPVAALPSAVSNYLKTAYGKATLLGAKQIVKSGQLRYEIALVQGGLFGKKHKNIYVNDQGVLVSP